MEEKEKMIKKPQYTPQEINSNIAYGMTSVNNITQDELNSIQWLCEKSMNDDYVIAELKQQLVEKEEQLANAIVPKFKIGQECWGIVPKTFWNKESYTIHFKVKAYIPDNNGIVLMLEDSITNLDYSYEWQVFATKEEAEAKLKELGEKK